MRNWTRFVASNSGNHGPKDHDGNRESHIGLKQMKTTPEIEKELRRRNKRNKKV